MMSVGYRVVTSNGILDVVELKFNHTIYRSFGLICPIDEHDGGRAFDSQNYMRMLTARRLKAFISATAKVRSLISTALKCASNGS
ncbi:Uncharacterised protein [Yokenella regensburgei]|uniref:Uncharacterized protein n=1 Tax=Yokenella regensburgei TaxID=158877 RepID=A0AB38FT58_9ENTR|nr:Uncharacterised protein [Yokenella regensburgei]SQA96120.1 Uncharacterised protein [Yokenella regensburgei]SUQ04242.1 Uncharacterised protein [Yokenella regensburgei]